MSWCTIESDPGVFTELVAQIGVKGIQFAEIWDLEKDTFDKLKPVYGLIFLFKWERGHHEAAPAVDNESDVFFAKQVINNACATQAILNILLNRPELELGPELRDFKEFGAALPADMRGEAIGNSILIRTAHNSFARPEPFESDEKAPATDDDEVYHFIGYVPVNGRLYELDGLKPGPIYLGDCTNEDWLDKVRPAIQTRIQKYSEKEIRFNLLAIVQNRTEVYNKRLGEIRTRREKLNAKLARLTGGGASMDVDESPADNLPATTAEIQNAFVALDEEQKECETGLVEEQERFARWKIENTRRKHNYVPFVFNLLKLLAEKGKLKGLAEEAKQAQEKAAAERKAKKEAADKAAKEKKAAAASSSASPPAQ